MKFRTVLTITLLLTAINGGIAIYWYLLPPPAKTVPDQAPVVTTAPEAPKPQEMPPPAETAPILAIPPEKKPPRTAQSHRTRRHPPTAWPTGSSWRKSARRLTLFRNNTPIKTYDIALGQQPEGPKQFAGDNKTPEGRYIIDSRKKNSSYHRALHISYPSSKDVALAARQKRSPGGSIMIHGLPKGMGYLGPLHRLRDWTAGCIAVTNTEIEEIWRAVPNGAPIEIRP